MFRALLLVAGAYGATAAAPKGFTLDLTPSGLTQFLGVPFTTEGPGSVAALRNSLVSATRKWANTQIAELNSKVGASEYPYFAWIPPLRAKLVPGAEPVTWAASCYQDVTGSAERSADGVSFAITMTMRSPKSPLCSDTYLFASLESTIAIEHFGVGVDAVRKVVYNVTANDLTSAGNWDLTTNGIRIFSFVGSWEQTLADIVATLDLFVPELTKDVPDFTAKANLDFLKRYAGIDMEPRSTVSVRVNKSLVHSGDGLYIVRLDGLDPMLAFAMGSTTGHVTTALWMGGELYVVESTVKDSYWPVDGIQRTPWDEWLQQAHEADFQVVWAPLSAENRAKFNETAAVEKFLEMEGLEYGYRNMLWGWVDTVKDNYPCFPPGSSTCLEWEHVMLIFSMMWKVSPNHADVFFSQAWNKRLGTSGLGPAEILQYSKEHNIDPSTIPTIVEEDSWLYNTTRFGEQTMGGSAVCCVFGCHIWKAGGLFDGLDDIQCTEQTNFDDYSLTMFDTTTPRPEACQQADPNNVVCQLEGKYTLHLNSYDTRKPYSHMGEKCPSMAPNYSRPSDC